MTTVLGILLGAAVIVIGIQGYMIAKLNDLTDRLLVANEQFGMATKQLVAINESIVSAAQDAQRLSVKAIEAAKDSGAELAIQIAMAQSAHPVSCEECPNDVGNDHLGRAMEVPYVSDKRLSSHAKEKEKPSRNA